MFMFMVFINQVASEIKHKLQEVDRIQENLLQEMLSIMEKVYDCESNKDKQVLSNAQQMVSLAKIFLAVTANTEAEKQLQLRLLAGGKVRNRWQKTSLNSKRNRILD